MILPTDRKKLYDAVFDQFDYCTRTMDSRASSYNRREAVYRRGSAGAFRGRLNKAAPIVNRQASLLFVPHMLKFFPQVPPEESDSAVFDRADAVSDCVRMGWRDMDLDVIFPMAIRWALVRGASLISVKPQVKTNWDIDIRIDFINPRDFGVGRETGTGSWDLERQQAVCLRSYHTMDELGRWLSGRKDPETILKNLEYGRVDSHGGFSRITGMAGGATAFQAKPENWPTFTGADEEDRARMAAVFHELRIFDDDLGDWRVFTISGSMILRDRPQGAIGVPGILPYVKVCPDEDPESFWGMSLVEQISPLQEWYLMRMEGMDERFRKRLRPPTAAIGLGQSFEEKIAGLNRAGGRVAIPNANAKFQQFPPEMAPEDFEMMQVISQQLNEQGQLPDILRGQMDKGVRGGEAINAMAKLANGEILQKSLVIESEAEDIANLIFHSMRRYSTQKLVDVNGKMFLLAEFPEDVQIKVDGHSSSPLLIEDHKAEADKLIQRDLIPPSRAIRMLAPVMESGILHDLGKVEMAKMIAAQKVKLEQSMKRGGKAGVGVEE
jgi:hypothetical protein